MGWLSGFVGQYSKPKEVTPRFYAPTLEDKLEELTTEMWKLSIRVKELEKKL